MRTLQEIKDDPQSKGRAIKAAIEYLEEGGDIDSSLFEKRIHEAYTVGKHRQPSQIKYQIKTLRRLFKRELTQ